MFGGINNPKFTSVVNDIKSPKTLFGTDSTDSGVISCAILNKDHLNEGNQPDHLMFDTTFNEESQKTISNSVRNILYKTNNVTLMFWGKLFDYNTHSPILIDALPDDRTQGLYFYLDQMLKADPNNPGDQRYFSPFSSGAFQLLSGQMLPGPFQQVILHHPFQGFLKRFSPGRMDPGPPSFHRHR